MEKDFDVSLINLESKILNIGKKKSGKFYFNMTILIRLGKGRYA